MEIALLSVAIVLIAVSVTLSVVTLLLSKRKKTDGMDGKDLLAEIDRISDNLNEAMNNINEHTSKERENLSSNFSNTILHMLTMYMDGFEKKLDKNLSDTKDTLTEIRRELQDTAAKMSEGTAKSLGDLKRDIADSLERMSKAVENSLDRISGNLKESLKEVRDDNKEQLEKVQKNNENQLEKIRATVDEKLSETLDNRIKTAFDVVNNSLGQVLSGFGEMKDLTNKVGNLNKMFANVKTRGVWGEVALQSLLDQILSPEQYRCQFRLDGKSREMVDFAIVMPGAGGETVYLPIDSKFPLDKYIAYIETGEKGDLVETEAARKELANAIKDEAKSISRKYIIQGVTTRFAVMYLPSEGMYAEIAKDSVLTSQIQNEYHVTICGPTTVTALLNSLQMGFTTLKIQKMSGEIAKALQDFQKDFKKYTELVTKIKDNANNIVNTIDKVEKRNDLISKRLAKVSGEMPTDGSQRLIAADVTDIDDADGGIGEE